MYDKCRRDEEVSLCQLPVSDFIFYEFIVRIMLTLWILVLVVVCLLKAGIIPTVTLYLMSTSVGLISTLNNFKTWHLIVAGVTIGVTTFMEVILDSQLVFDGGIMNISSSFFSISSTICAMYMAVHHCKEHRTFYVSYLVSIGSILTVFFATMGITGAKPGRPLEQ